MSANLVKHVINIPTALRNALDHDVKKGIYRNLSDAVVSQCRSALVNCPEASPIAGDWVQTHIFFPEKFSTLSPIIVKYKSFTQFVITAIADHYKGGK